MKFESGHSMYTPPETAKAGYIKTLVANGMAPKTEIVPVAEANGRVTAEPVYAKICSPDFDSSAVDGFAVRAALTASASDAAPATLAAGQFIRVMTGDPLPDGCDAVVMAEDADADPEAVTIHKPVAYRQNIRQMGEDICAGEMILPSFSYIGAAALGAMIVGGITELTVARPPIAGVITTETEPAADAQAAKGKVVPGCNTAVFTAMLRDWGAKTKVYPAVEDERGEILDVLNCALAECDIVVLNAGSSAGVGDAAETAMSEAGEVLYRGLAIKPGHTAVLGICGAKPIVGAPGYPVSGIIVLEQILRPIVELLCRKTAEPERMASAALSKPIVSDPGYREFVRVRLGYVRDRLIASPLGRGSGIVTSFMKADGIVEVPQGSEGFGNGETVSARLLRSEAELRRSIVVVGSHDPLLDELTELLRLRFGGISMASSHVGSMGGLVAVRKGEAHIAGIHLLDEATGEYNSPFIEKAMRKGGARLVECVKRSQGFILQKGNPKKISCVADLTGSGLRYINRQKGSGTRILIDYLCRRDGVDTSSIDGFGREEFTHTSVAALIASGAADTGLGIFSAAKLYDLDFLPVCEEQYDLLIPDHAWDLPMVQKLLEVLKSEEFARRMDVLGGYSLCNPGGVRLRVNS